MRTYRKKRFAFINADNASAFEVLLNEKLDELADCDPQVEFGHHSDLFARITYMQQVPLEDEPPSETGIKFKCGDCPLFEHIKNRDGSPDRRRKYGYCGFGPATYCYKSSDACDHLYRLIADGRIVLTLVSDEEEEE